MYKCGLFYYDALNIIMRVSSIERKYNYIYQITNLINNKIYIGIHKTDNLEDGYMGSGSLIKMSINKYGIENFRKDILKFYETYEEAIEEEIRLVTESFIEDPSNYNIRTGGVSQIKWSDYAREKLSKSAKILWSDPNHMIKMREVCYDNPERNAKLGKGIKKWIVTNPEKHKIRMDKINKNPEKIEKMRLKHVGMKRSKEAVENMKQAQLKIYSDDPKKASEFRGKGKIYIHNPVSKEIKRISKTESIPIGWVKGSGIDRKQSHKNLNKGSVFAHDPITLKNKRFANKEQIPENYIIGRFKK